LEKAGYVIEDRLTNAIEFGVPQDRERIIIIGVLKKNLKQHKEKLDIVWSGLKYPDRKAFEEYQWIQEEEFIVNSLKEKPPLIPEELTVEYWFRKNNVDSHPNSTKFFTPRAGLEKFLIIKEGDDGKKSFKRLHRWRYSPTAAYGNNEVHLHPYKARRLSIAEVLAIQSAPVQFELPDDMTLSNMFKTLGNAVPYLMARGIARSVESILVRANDTVDSKRLGRRDSESGYWEELPVRKWAEFNPVATDSRP